jgi:SAM-dependent methyltransferase
MTKMLRFFKKSILPSLLDMLLAVRSLLFIGRRYTCPCCGWKLRAFTRGGTSLKVRQRGYCPRCNSKARHRRDWLFLEQKTDLFVDHLRLLEVSPKYSLSRRFVRMPNLEYVGVDLRIHPNVSARMDITAIAVRSKTFDAVICIHVLEEITEDHQAIRELFRVIRPGGWALITVPTQLDQKTYEDPTITDPQERERAFGELAHVRIYGHDLVERLEACGFQVKLDLGIDVDAQTKEKYGLNDDENIFYCTKT